MTVSQLVMNPVIIFNKITDTRPIHWNNFYVEREWVLDVPLEEQIIFEAFLNRTTIEKRTNDVNICFKQSVYVCMPYMTLCSIS